jgi:hypothetical protein
MLRLNHASLEALGDGESQVGRLWCTVGIAHAHAMLLPPEEAWRHIEAARRILDEKTQGDCPILMLCSLTGFETMVLACLGELDRAREAADRVMAYARRIDMVAASLFPTLEGPLWAYIACWRSWLAESPGQVPEVARAARRALRAYRAWARLNPVGKPRMLIFAGEIDWIEGRHERARDRWRRVLDLAAAMSLPWEEACAHLALGRTASPGSTDRRRHLERARALFSRFETPYFVNQAERLMEDNL